MEGSERLLIAVAGPAFRTEEGASVEFDFRGGLYLFDTAGRRLG